MSMGGGAGVLALDDEVGLLVSGAGGSSIGAESMEDNCGDWIFWLDSILFLSLNHVLHGGHNLLVGSMSLTFLQFLMEHLILRLRRSLSSKYKCGEK